MIINYKKSFFLYAEDGLFLFYAVFTYSLEYFKVYGICEAFCPYILFYIFLFDVLI